LSAFSLDSFTKIYQSEKLNVYTQTILNWNYENVEEYLLTCTDFVRENPSSVLLIFCSHPHCYTLGKGLQKLPPHSAITLIDFEADYNEEKKLDYPLYQLKRGGGLTFHYPGQMVFYPIINLTYQKLKVHDLMLEILELTKKILIKNFDLKNLSINKELLGVWTTNENIVEKKIASIGLAVTKFTTYHGLALNLLNDEAMFNSIKKVHPCGLPGDLYTSVESLRFNQPSKPDLDYFRECFQNEFLHLMIERHMSSFSTSSEISF